MTGETYRDSKDPILTELHMVEMGVVGEENDSENGCMLLLRTVMKKGIAVSRKYSVSFKMPFFLANQGYIR